MSDITDLTPHEQRLFEASLVAWNAGLQEPADEGGIGRGVRVAIAAGEFFVGRFEADIGARRLAEAKTRNETYQRAPWSEWAAP